MSDVAISVRNLGKMFRIGTRREAYGSLRDTLVKSATAPFRRMGSILRGESYGAADLSVPIWALKDVTFDIQQGEVVGIIGRNGAGKSTLLKVLSQITEPTEGYAEVYGRVGSLLEVGTGFHPELTGRENVYLSGAILGMSRKEIDRQFDAIVDFAELDKFIDTPLKHYSSGMGLRLGFAVAAHLTAEILFIDEVLAVGDQAFQRKCIDKMGEVSQMGRTILFVSHNMSTVAGLTGRCIVLDRGEVKYIGNTDEAIRMYAAQGRQSSFSLRERTDRRGDRKIVINSVTFLDETGQPTSSVPSGSPLTMVFEYTSTLSSFEMNAVMFDVRFTDMTGHPIVTFSTRYSHNDALVEGETGCFVCHVPQLLLVHQTYFVDVKIKYRAALTDEVMRAAELEVSAADWYGTGQHIDAAWFGSTLMQHSWKQTGDFALPAPSVAQQESR